MDILYVIGKGSKHDNEELRMSLRAIARFAKNVGKVVVAGYPPDFLSGEVVKLPVEDRTKSKHTNICWCIWKAVEKGILGDGPFLYSSDDHFYVRPVDVNQTMIYTRQLDLFRVDDNPEKDCNKWRWSLIATGMALQQCGLGGRGRVICFEQHCNTVVFPEAVRVAKLLGLLDHNANDPMGYAPTTLFMNIEKYIHPELVVPHMIGRPDMKVPGDRFNDFFDLMTDIGDRDTTSFSDTFYDSPLWKVFCEELYPDKCKYEK